MRVVTTKVPNLLARELKRPGGLTLEEAVQAADAKLETIRGPVTADVHAKLDRIQALGGELLANRDDAAADALYALSNAVASTAGTFGLQAVGDVAFSLCELLDRWRTAQRWDRSALKVHLDSLRLLRTDRALTAQQQSAIVAALARVVHRS